MVSATVVENVSIDPFGKLVRSDDTTLKYGSGDEIELVELENICSQKYFNVRLPPKLATYKHNDNKLYISNIPPSLITQHNSCIEPRIIQSSKLKVLLTQLTTLLVKSFEANFETMHILNSRNFSIFTIGYLNAKTNIFQPIGCACYHFNPLVGVFVSFLAVPKKFQKTGYGSSLLILLQALFNKNMGTSRMLVWCDCSDNKSIKLISFYRKLGFFPTIPTNYPLSFLLSSITIHEIRSVNKPNVFLLEARKLIWEKYDEDKFLSFPPMVSRDLGKQKVKPLYLRNSFKGHCNCCICEINLDPSNDAFVFCLAKCSTNQHIQGPNGNQICGSFVCLSCQSNFGLDTSAPFCPLHAGSSLQQAGFQKKDPDDTMIRDVAKEYKKLQSTRLDTKSYFNSCFEGTKSSPSLVSGSEMDRDDKAFLCIHCQTKECIKANYDFEEGRELSVFSMYNECGEKPELLPYLIHSEEHPQYIKQMRDIEIQRGGRTSCNHTKFLDANIGAPTSFYQHKMFGVKNVAGFGDCGFLSIYISIITSSEELKDQYTKCFLTYIEDTEVYLDSKFSSKTEEVK